MTEPSTDADDRTPNTLLNGVIGGLVGLLLSFIPFSTVLGGAVAGYLEGGDTAAGAKVGLIAGVVTLVPFLLLFVVFLGLVPVMGPEASFAIGLFGLFALLFGAVYVVGFSVVGGIVGVYLKEEL